MISASVTSPQITASANGSSISANVSVGGVAATVTSGIGQTGPSGVTTLSGASDVAMNSTADGDVLRYSSGKWRNYPEVDLVDGGNW
jgi:hypothetical protein